MSEKTNQQRLADLKRIQFLVRNMSAENSFLSKLPFKLLLVIASMMMLWVVTRVITIFDLSPIVSAGLLLVLALTIFVMFKKLPADWEQVLAAMLLMYRPVNIEAFEQMRLAHVDVPALQMPVIQEWLDVERISILTQERCQVS